MKCKYRLFGGSGIAPEEKISKELVKVIETANTRLLCNLAYSDRRTVSISLENIKAIVGTNKTRRVVVEALHKADKILFDAYGSSWLMFNGASFDKENLTLVYKPNAASVLKAIMLTEDYE